MTHTLIRSAQAALALSLGVALAGCGTATNPSLESIHQPVVQRTNYTLDLNAGPGGLSLPEQRRLSGWFEAMNLRYGDQISIDDPLSSPATRASIASVAGNFSMLVSDDAPTTQGFVNAGTVRVILTRSTASVPGCPDWSTNTDFNPRNGTSAGYGCSVNGNLAAMVANPEHLIHGAKGNGETVVMSSTKAIESYRSEKPTGQGGLKANSTQSGK